MRVSVQNRLVSSPFLLLMFILISFFEGHIFKVAKIRLSGNTSADVI